MLVLRLGSVSPDFILGVMASLGHTGSHSNSDEAIVHLLLKVGVVWAWLAYLVGVVGGWGQLHVEVFAPS